jgi:viroplasmin and RNaseH domain-containing protein
MTFDDINFKYSLNNLKTKDNDSNDEEYEQLFRVNFNILVDQEIALVQFCKKENKTCHKNESLKLYSEKERFEKLIDHLIVTQTEIST